MLELGFKLRDLRKKKNVSQEKLASFLNVSFQAVSKWESGATYPDITLLPNIARFFDITVDELLQVEKIDEKKLYDEFEKKAELLYRNGDIEGNLKIWQEAYKKMPNNIDVKEMLMSVYYDLDMVKYQDEIIELASDIYNSDCNTYYKGQTIHHLSYLYAELGKVELAEKWANKSYTLFHSKEILFTSIFNGEETIKHVSWCMYWFLYEMYWFAARIVYDKEIKKDLKYKQNIFKTVADIYEVVYKNDDMSFEMLKLAYILHADIAKWETLTTKDEEVVKHHLNRAKIIALKSKDVKEHKITHPLLEGWTIQDAPSNNLQIIEMLEKFLRLSEFDEYRNLEWFKQISGN